MTQSPSETEYKYVHVPKRDDIDEIRASCTLDSIDQRMTSDTWNTLYRDTYIRHPIGPRYRGKPPRLGINIGGGNFSPNEQERLTNYQSTFKSFGETVKPERATGIPPADIIHDQEPCPKYSTSESHLRDIQENRPIYDNSEAKERSIEGKKHHLYFGDGDPDFKTTYDVDYRGERGEPIPQPNSNLWKSSVEFPPEAGVGPHTKQLRKRSIFPNMPDAPRRDHYNKNFDLGYSSPDYETSTQAALPGNYGVPKPQPFKAPPCATINEPMDELPWVSSYSLDYKRRKFEPNTINKEELKRVHFDPGHEINEWPKPQTPPPMIKPKKEKINLQESNVVFRGSGEMSFNTTSNDTLGSVDPKLASSYGRNTDCKNDHLFFGTDDPEYVTTAKDANKKAGTGKPAPLFREPKRPVCFAQGGLWDPNQAEDPLAQKRSIDTGSYPAVDPRYFTGTHFDLDSSLKNQGIYETTYWEEICRRTIEN